MYNLVKQVREEVHILESDCPLYTAAGIPPPADLDEKVEKDFNDVLRLTNKVGNVHPFIGSPSLHTIRVRACVRVQVQYWDLMREEKNTAVVFGKAAYVKEEKKLAVPAPREEEQDAKKAETPRVKKEEVEKKEEEEEESIQVPSMEEDLEAEAKPDTEAQQHQGDESAKSEPSEQPASVEDSVAPEVKQEATTEAKQEATEEQKAEALATFYAELMGDDAGQPGASGNLHSLLAIRRSC